MQYVKFPMKYMNITQGVNGTYSHQGSNAIDNAGKDEKIDNAFAPFDGVIKNIYTKSGNVVWLESSSPVKFADGHIGFATVSFTHDNNVKGLRVGQKIKQGDVFYQEGTAGNADGNHVHIEVAKGKFTGSGWTLNKYGHWVLNNSIRPEKAFYINGVTVINDYEYKWKKYEEVEMVSKTIATDERRHQTGKDPSKSELKQWVGKMTADQLRKHIRTLASYKIDLKNAKSGKLNPVDHLPGQLRDAIPKDVKKRIQDALNK